MRLCYHADPDSIHTRRWLSFFESRGHEIDLICDFEPKEPLHGVRMHLLQLAARRAPQRWLDHRAKIQALLNKIKPQILHAHVVSPYGYWGAASGFHPFVLTPWGSDIFITANSSLWHRFLTRWALTAADLITVESDELRKAAVKLGANQKKIQKILWGVDLPSFEKRQDVRRLREEFGIPVNDLVVLSMRNFRPLYNHRAIIEAAPEILNLLPNTFFLFVGKGEQKGELQSLAEKLGVSTRIKMLDQQPYHRVPQLLALADIYISIPSSDSVSATLLEAMASGKPVIVSDIPANREWVTDGENGVVIRPEARKVEEAVLSLARDESLRREFGARNREKVRQGADHSPNMLKMEELYYSLVK